jgi:hypothetical protein
MKVRCYVVGVSWLVALGVICQGTDHRANDSPRSSSNASETPLLVKPYLQLGNVSPGKVVDDLVLLWHADLGEAVWAVEYQTGAEAAWRLASPPTSRRITVPGLAPHQLFRPGNHDIATRDLEKFPDTLAYFLYWDQPRNGPLGVQGGPLIPPLTGPVANRRAFVTAAGDTYPLRFTPETDKNGKPVRDQNKVPGRWMLDKVFDGHSSTRPHGVIYLVTGAGGNTLYNPEQQDDPGSWQSFTHKFISKIHTLTVADVSGTALTVRQVSLNGAELDRFTITK